MLSSRILAIGAALAFGGGVAATAESASGEPAVAQTGSADGRAIHAAHGVPAGGGSPQELVLHPALAAPPDRRALYDRLHRGAERHGLDPGRNIVREGVIGVGGARSATWPEVEDAIAAIRREGSAARRAAEQDGATELAVAAGEGHAGAAPDGRLQSIAACESGGNPGAVDPSGTYRGKYQFDRQTWQSVGGSGDPAAAPEGEQDMRAANLMAQRGGSPWPNC